MNIETYALRHPEAVASPALLYYRDLIVNNTEAVISIAKDAGRLWPHVKSHKMEALVRMQMEMGIHRFKCATISELRMVSACGASHIVMAYPLVGPNVALFLDVVESNPAIEYFAIADSLTAAGMLSREAEARGMKVNLLVDVNAGMDRTGITPDALFDFCIALSKLPGIKPSGFHCYDGHVHDESRPVRAQRSHAPMERVMEVKGQLKKEGIDMPVVIAGGSPTFPCHAEEEGVFLSPGTVFLWDWGYSKFSDLPLVPAALVLTRVVSHPAEGLFTIDVGNKAIASDPIARRGAIVGLEDAEPIRHSEEHWVWRVPEGKKRPEIGDVLYVIPAHVCPTSALYREAIVVEGGEIVGTWPVTARDRITYPALF
jgi:D-serine deaminase-like pyridoxal phosphate-dependent protein